MLRTFIRAYFQARMRRDWPVAAMWMRTIRATMGRAPF